MFSVREELTTLHIEIDGCWILSWVLFFLSERRRVGAIFCHGRVILEFFIFLESCLNQMCGMQMEHSYLCKGFNRVVHWFCSMDYDALKDEEVLPQK
jgi:hypothetical protein